MSEQEQPHAPESNPPPTTVPQTTTQAPSNGDNTTLMGILAYCGPLVFIPFFTAKDQPFVRYHVRQGLVLFVLYAGLFLVDEIFYFGRFWQLLDFAFWALTVFSIIGIINVIGKHEKELPLIGKFSKFFNF